MNTSDSTKNKSKARSFFKGIFSYFGQGLLYIAPISITLYVIYRAFLYIDNILPFHFPGLGLLVIFTGITLVGLLASAFFAKPLIAWFGKTVDKIPLLNMIYGSMKDLLGAFVGKKKKFTKPVLVRIQKDSEVFKLGFLTDNDVTNLGISNDLVAVYLPHSYNFSGNLFLVPRNHVIPLEVPPADVMKYIVSGGVIEPEQPEDIL